MMRTQALQQRQRQTGSIPESNQPKWFNSPVSFHEGTMKEIRTFMPEFERRSFALSSQAINVPG